MSDYGLSLSVPPGWLHQSGTYGDFAFSYDRVRKTPAMLVLKKGLAPGKGALERERAIDIKIYSDAPATFGPIFEGSLAGKRVRGYSVEKPVVSGTMHEPGGPQVTRAVVTRYCADDGSFCVETTLPLGLRHAQGRALQQILSSLAPLDEKGGAKSR